MPPTPPPRPHRSRKNPSPVPHRAALASVYGAASLAAATTLPPAAATASIAWAWASYVGAISFTEAWVKFRAPTLDAAAAVDAGRHVFAALNACEAGMGAGLVLALARGGAPPALVRRAAPPLVALALDIAWLTPALDARARHRIAAASLPGGGAEREAAVREIVESVRGQTPPPAALHSLYVLGEAAKLVSLAALTARAAGPLIARAGDGFV